MQKSQYVSGINRHRKSQRLVHWKLVVSLSPRQDVPLPLSMQGLYMILERILGAIEGSLTEERPLLRQ